MMTRVISCHGRLLLTYKRPHMDHISMIVQPNLSVTQLSLHFSLQKQGLDLIEVLRDLMEKRCTVFPAYSDTLGTKEKCHSKQVPI